MQLKLVKTIYRKELRDILRDRRTLFVMVVLPLLTYPLLIIGFMQLMTLQIGRLAQKPLRLALIGQEHSGKLGEALASAARGEAGRHARLADEDRHLGPRRRRDLFRGLRGFAVAAGKMPGVQVYYNSSEKISERARNVSTACWTVSRAGCVEERLLALKADTTLLHPFAVQDENLATDQQQQGDLMGSLLGYLLISMMLMGAFYPAIDLTAGEKERGTMETLLVSPASRADIVYGKFLTVMTIALMTALLNLLSLGGSLYFMLRMVGNLATRRARRRAGDSRDGDFATVVFNGADPCGAAGGAVCRAVPGGGGGRAQLQRRPEPVDPHLYGGLSAGDGVAAAGDGSLTAFWPWCRSSMSRC